MSDAFSTAVHRLYEAAGDPAAWTGALRALEDLSGSAGATLNFVPRRAGVGGMVLSGRFTPDVCAEYSHDWMPMCRRIVIAHTRPDLEYTHDAAVGTEAEMDRDPVYDWFGTLGLRYHVGTRLPDIGDHHVNFSFQRTRAHGHVQGDDIALLARLKPHIAQATTLAAKLGSLSAQWRFGMAMLDSLPHAVLVLDEHGRMLFANRAADTLLAENDGLVVRDRILSARRASDAARLARIIAGALAPPAPTADTGGGWLRLARPSGRLHYALFVAPLVGEAPLAILGRPSAVVIVHDPERQAAVDPAALRALYDLTAAEARLTAALAAGADVAAAARRLGITPGTARIHLKAVFRKVGVNRQQDLARLLAPLAATAAPNGE